MITKQLFLPLLFFKADTTFYIDTNMEQEAVLDAILKKLSIKNAMYAIRVTGTFSTIKTRAFPPVKEEPFPVLSSILERQQFLCIKTLQELLLVIIFLNI